MDGDPRLIGCRVDMGVDESLSGIAGGDVDSDGDVDLHDFAAFQVCFGTTLVTGETPPSCLCTFDFDESATVDLDDYRTFQEHVTSP